jgi:hypothetical protein
MIKAEVTAQLAWSLLSPAVSGDELLVLEKDPLPSPASI